MRAYQLEGATTDFSGLKSTESPRPSPDADEVLIRIHACSLNYRDLIVADSELGFDGSIDGVVPLSDGAGEVVEVGESVDGLDTGDRVVTPFFPEWTKGGLPAPGAGDAIGIRSDGTLAEYATYPAESVPLLPAHLSFEQGATLPCAGLTAWHALVENGEIRAGERVLIQGTGGVSTFALQFAEMHGADSFVLSSSDEKLETARELGARETLNYERTPEWGDVVHRRTGGGVDHVVEVGGVGTLPESFAAASRAGEIHLIGRLSESDDRLDPAPALRKGLDIRCLVHVGSTAMFRRMNRAIEANEMQPVVDRVFAFEDAPTAYQYLKEGAHQGKVVIAID